MFPWLSPSPPHFCPRVSQRQAGHRAGAGDSALEGGVLLGLAAVGWVPPSSQLAPAASGLSLTSPPQPCPPPPWPPERCFLVPPLHGPWPEPEPALPGVKGWSDCLWSGKGVGAFLQVKAWGCGGGWGWGGGCGGLGAVASLAVAGESQLLVTRSGCSGGPSAWAPL